MAKACWSFQKAALILNVWNKSVNFEAKRPRSHQMGETSLTKSTKSSEGFETLPVAKACWSFQKAFRRRTSATTAQGGAASSVST